MLSALILSLLASPLTAVSFLNNKGDLTLCSTAWNYQIRKKYFARWMLPFASAYYESWHTIKPHLGLDKIVLTCTGKELIDTGKNMYLNKLKFASPDNKMIVEMSLVCKNKETGPEEVITVGIRKVKVVKGTSNAEMFLQTSGAGVADINDIMDDQKIKESLHVKEMMDEFVKFCAYGEVISQGDFVYNPSSISVQSVVVARLAA